MISREQVAFYAEHGWLHIPRVFSEAEMAAMEADLSWMMDLWAEESMGWDGPWRKEYMDEATEAKSTLIHLHDLQFYSDAWLNAVTKPNLAAAMVALLGDDVELHHTTLHAKPPETGHPFPMHQDNAFYRHADGRYVDVLVHLDDTCHENGEIRFLDGSHKMGELPHVTEWDGKPCTPHLPTAEWKLEDTVAVPAKRGDVVCFNIFTIHGSYINQTDRIRRLVRVGYRSPANRQFSGQSAQRPGIMVHGRRPNPARAAQYSTELA